MKPLRCLFFDFGGCIDAPGIHTRVLFWDAYRQLELLPAELRETFQEAYTRADQRMMATGEARLMGLGEFNRHNSRLIAGEFPQISRAAADGAGDLVTGLMDGYIRRSRETLVDLRQNFQLGVISNFTGNLEVIMTEFALRELFDSVTESFYVGHSKPDERIFRAALAKQKFSPEECLYIGDNPKNDILPARELGMRTALIHPAGKKQDCGADFYVGELRALVPLIESK
jgi:putative hydrolase of the HAD superfamily